MALSKVQRTSCIADKNEPLTIDKNVIEKLCKVSYTNAISVEIISHLLGGQNMDYMCMEVEDTFQCYNYCRNDILEFIKKSNEEITFFEDCKDTTTNIIIAVIKRNRTSSQREHIIFKSAARMTIMVEPRVGFVRYFDFRGMSTLIQFCDNL